MHENCDLRYEGPEELVTTASDPEAARIGAFARSGLPAGAEVCVTAGDYRAHAEGTFAVEGLSAGAGDAELTESEPAERFFEREQRRLTEPGRPNSQFRLATARASEPIDRGGHVVFDLRISAGGHAGNPLALDVRVRPPGNDQDDDAAWERVGSPVVLPARAGPPANIEIRPQFDGARLRATVFAVDALLNPTGHPGSVRVEAVEGAVDGLPTTVSLADGPARIDGGVTSRPVRLRASSERGATASTPRLGTSRRATPADRPLFGAIHFHTEFSGDGGRPMADAYRYARDTLGLDFAAATDHSPGGVWGEVASINEEFYDPGSFVTLPAWEWSTSEGHANLYLRSQDSTATPDRAYDADFPYHVEWPDDAIMAPHHTNQRSDELTDEGEHYWREYDWSVGNDRMGFVEVHQTRGNFEADAVDPDWRITDGGIGASVQDALDRGYRLGFVAGTDNHTGYPTRGAFGSYDDLAGRYAGSHDDIVGRYIGLTGVYAGERTRGAIWDALEARRSYATTGVPIRVGFAVNGEPLGGVAPVDGGNGPDPTFDADLHGTAPIERVEVIADAETVWSADPGERDVHVESEALPDPGDPGYYYLRMRQADDHMAWTSPVWIGE